MYIYIYNLTVFLRIANLDKKKSRNSSYLYRYFIEEMQKRKKRGWGPLGEQG